MRKKTAKSLSVHIEYFSDVGKPWVKVLKTNLQGRRRKRV